MNCMGMWYSSANLAATDSVSRFSLAFAESLCEEGAFAACSWEVFREDWEVPAIAWV